MEFLTSEANFAVKDGLQSLYFYATWMPFHKKMLLMIDKVQQKHKNIEFIGIDVDHFKGFCKRFEIDSIPTVLILKGGIQVKRIQGITMTSAFKSAFADICDLGDNNEQKDS